MNMFQRLFAKLFGRQVPQRVVFNGCTVQVILGSEVEFSEGDDDEEEPEQAETEVEMSDRSMEARWILRTQAEVDALEQVAAESPMMVRVKSEYQTLPKWWSVTVWTVNDKWFNYLQYLRFEQLGKATLVARALGERLPAQALPSTPPSEG
jgi:hypothetical protein